ncbi:hypothetical protein EYF80_048808 [Liparis tanakae]|uniref:Uncharacterized protein n=1 Tax=Liparis tanakae TaxID=230148 RepID=A0A4Z2FIQ0_9TELE|nr:hypothetical protein EYF80_048808 [Liparis tanakae]
MEERHGDHRNLQNRLRSGWLPMETTHESVIYVAPRYRDICEATQVTFRSSALRHPGLGHAANTPAHMQATGGRHMLHRTVRVR